MGAFPSPYKHIVTETDVEIEGGVNAEQFVEWALQVSAWGVFHEFCADQLQVRLLDTLDQVLKSSSARANIESNTRVAEHWTAGSPKDKKDCLQRLTKIGCRAYCRLGCQAFRRELGINNGIS